MTFETLLAFNVALIVSILSPGPAFLMAVRTTLGAGRKAGIAVGCGLGLVASMWTLAALLGLDIVFDLFPWAYTVIKTGGALYLIYIAYGMWRDAKDGIEPKEARPVGAFRQGVLVNLLNPKSVVFAAAILVVIFPPGLSVTENALIVANHLVLELLFYTGLAFGLSTPAVSKRYLQAKAYFDRTAALVLGGLGVRLISDR